MTRGDALWAALLALIVAGFAFPCVWLARRGAEEPSRVRCWPAEGYELLTREPSPDGARVALLFQTNGGATTAFGAEVCVEERGVRRVVAVGYSSNEPRITWESATRLRIDELSDRKPPRVVDVTSGIIVCEPVREDWDFCKRDGTR